jgi:hypothetical protein
MSQSAIGARARIPNPALKPLEFLVGEWRTTGAFLIMRSEVDEPRFPDGVAIIGSSDIAGTFAMIYFDERGTSRIFQVSVGDRTVTWRRDDPDFSQSLTITAEGGDRLVSQGRMTTKDGIWTDDLSQLFTREARA